jgi:hypothetical protein
MPAVKAMANAPHIMTRQAPIKIFAPPITAANPPNNARNKSDAPAMTGISIFNGVIKTIRSGNAAPIENVIAEVRAA